MQSVLRAFAVLEAVGSEQPVSVSHLTALLELPKSTVQRNLLTLEKAGWIRQVRTDTTRWVVSPRALMLRPHEFEGGGELLSTSLPVMRQLRDDTNETVHLSVPDQRDGMVLVTRVDCEQPVRTYYPLGSTSPMHLTSTGLAVLAHWPREWVDAMIDRGLEKRTDKTITDPHRLREELDLIAERGYSLNAGMNRHGVCSIGAAVFGQNGTPLAGMCISMPDLRFDEGHLEHWGKLVRDAARAVSASPAP